MAFTTANKCTHTRLKAGSCSAGQRGIHVVENNSLQRVLTVLHRCVSLCLLPRDRAEAGGPQHRVRDLDGERVKEMRARQRGKQSNNREMREGRERPTVQDRNREDRLKKLL